MSDSVFDSELARRIWNKHASGHTWSKLGKRAQVSQTTIIRFAEKNQPISSASYKKLLKEYGPDLPGTGTPQATPDRTQQPRIAPTLFRATITLEGTFFLYDGFHLTFGTESGDVHTVQLPQGTPVNVEAAE